MKSQAQYGASLCRCLGVSRVSSSELIGRSILSTDHKGKFDFRRLRTRLGNWAGGARCTVLRTVNLSFVSQGLPIQILDRTGSD